MHDAIWQGVQWPESIVCAYGIPRHVNDIRPVHGENNTVRDHVTPLDPSDDEADLVVYEAVEENSSASSAPGGLRREEFSDTSEDNVTQETESVPIRRSSEQEPEICTAEAISEPAPSRRSGPEKKPAPHCPMWSWDQGEVGRSCEEPFHRRSKSFRVTYVFHDCRASGRRGTQHGGEPELR